MARSTRSSAGRSKKHIDLTSIKSTSTCLDLEFPRDMCCNKCQVKQDTKFGLAKRSSVGAKRFHDYAHESQRCCKQPWAFIHGSNHCDVATNRKFARVQAYLGVKYNVNICCYNYYDEGNKRHRSLLANESTMAPLNASPVSPSVFSPVAWSVSPLAAPLVALLVTPPVSVSCRSTCCHTVICSAWYRFVCYRSVCCRSVPSLP